MDKSKEKMLEYEDCDHFNGNEWTHSLDSEFGGFDEPILRSPGVRKALTSANEKLCRSTCEKNPLSRFGYNDYMAYHYAFMMKVATVREPEFVFRGNQGPTMGQRNEQRDACNMQERDMRSRS